MGEWATRRHRRDAVAGRCTRYHRPTEAVKCREGKNKSAYIEREDEKKNDSRTLDLQFRTIDNTGTDQLNERERASERERKELIHPECFPSPRCSLTELANRHSVGSSRSFSPSLSLSLTTCY